jgi:hypothetical protein
LPAIRHDNHRKIAGFGGEFERNRIVALAGQFESDVLASVSLAHPHTSMGRVRGEQHIIAAVYFGNISGNQD